MDNYIFKCLGAKAVAGLPGVKAVTIVIGGKYFQKSRHLRFELGFSYSGTARCHGAKGSAVVTIISGYKLVFLGISGLFIIR